MNKQSQQEALWCFRRWSRKPWAAFSGMCRFKYGHLSVAMSIILLATHIAGAQTLGTDSLSGELRTLHLDAVNVTARQSQAVAISRTVVSQTRFLVDQQRVAPLGTSEAALRLLPSIDVRERGGKSVQTDIAIRGGSFDQTMVMLNGVDFSDPRTGHQSHSLPVDIDILSTIEIFDGVSRPGALAGAIDFRTAAAYPRYLRARLEGGAWGYGYGNLSGGWTHRAADSGDRLTLFGAASYRRSDGYRHNTDFWNLNAYGRVVYDSPRAGRFDIQGGFQRREWGSNGFYSLRYPDQFESTLTGLTSVKWRKSWGRFSLGATGSFRQNNDLFEMERDDPSNIPFNHHTTYSTGGEIYGDYYWRRAGTTSLGVDYIHHRMLSTAMGETLPDPSHKIPGEDGLYPKGVSRGVASVWLGHVKSWSNGISVHGLGTLVHTPYGTDGTFGVEAFVPLRRFWYMEGVVQRSMRLPTFTDLFYNVATYHPDPNLKPETAMKGRLTVGNTHLFGSTAWSGEASAWYRRTTGVIDWEQRPDMDPDDGVDETGHWWSTQLNRIGSVGAEMSIRYSDGDDWLRVAMLNYGYVRSDKNVATGYISKYALDYMRHKLSAVVGIGFLRSFTLTFVGSVYDRVGSYIDADGAQTGYSPYFLLDGRLSWELPEVKRGGDRRGAGLQLYVDATNITDSRYFDFGGLPMPGTWVSAGIVLTIR